MNKKDAIFLATILMLKDKFPDFKPDETIEQNKNFSNSFISLYRYLYAVYGDIDKGVD